MKKSIFILAALYAAAFANAQITLEHTFDGIVSVHTTFSPREYDAHSLSPIVAPCFYHYTRAKDGTTALLTLYDKNTYAEYKTINLNTTNIVGLNDREYRLGYITALSYDVLAKNKVAFIVAIDYNSYCGDGSPCGLEPAGYALIDEDGIVLQKFLDRNGYAVYYDYDYEQEYVKNPCVVKLGNEYKLIIHRVENSSTIYTEVYSLPGSGAETFSVPASPKRSLSTRKVVRKGNVLVETRQNTFSATGAVVK